MKRSELIKHLEGIFFNYDNYKNIAERALSAVEAHGMLPPCKPPIGSGDFDCESCGGCHAYHTSDCEWEKEE